MEASVVDMAGTKHVRLTAVRRHQMGAGLQTGKGPPAAAGLLALALLASCASRSEAPRRVAEPDAPWDVRATETVWCADPDGVVDTIVWEGHDGNLSDIDVRVLGLSLGSVTDEDLVRVCANPGPATSAATICAAHTDEAVVVEYAGTDFVTAVHGEPTADRPGFPIVLRGAVDCDDVELHIPPVTDADPYTWADQLRTWRSTKDYNTWRAVEGRFGAAAEGGCLDVEAAREMALAARSELPGDWPVLESTHGADDPEHAGLCFDVRLHRSGVIRVEYRHFQSPGGR
jgi:hypothetical protein